MCVYVCVCVLYCGASQVSVVVKNLPANAGDIRDVGSVPGTARSPGRGKDNTHQYSCLQNPMDRGVWRATVRGTAELDTTKVTEHTHTSSIAFIFWKFKLLQGTSYSMIKIIL